MQGNIRITNGFMFGLLGGLGVLAALVLGNAIATLASILTYIAAALFIALGLDPIISWLGRRNIKRAPATAIVTLALLTIIAALFWGIAPAVTEQASNLISIAPTAIESISKLDFVISIDKQFNGAVTNSQIGRAHV